MVGTRNHPKDFPPPTESPTKRTTRSSTTSTNTSNHTRTPSIPKPTPSVMAEKIPSPTKSLQSISLKPTTRSSSTTTPSSWAHAPHPVAIPWLAASLPLVIWDTGYIMLRPHTLPGGSLSWPLYAPYELYGRVDPVYSPEAYHSGLGWTGAQGLGNVFETIAYFAYLWVVIAYGQNEGRGEGVWGLLGPVGHKRRVHGWWGAVASLLGYTTFAITVGKSVLYCESEAWFASQCDHFTDFSFLVSRVQRCFHGISPFQAEHLVQSHLCFYDTQVSAPPEHLLHHSKSDQS